MNDVEEVKNRLDIIEVVGGYVPLKQAGRNFKGLSPFKSEKTPSFMVSAEKGIWHDFSTGKGGDVISFVMLMEGMEFRDALEMLARRAGVQLKPRSAQAAKTDSKKTRLYEATELAMRYFHYCLSRNQTALQYFQTKRGLSSATIKLFKLGYSPDSWDSLLKFLSKKGFQPQELKDAGLVTSKAGKDSFYDNFRGRAMFPVFDAQNRAIGFSARVLDAEAKAAKYINTTQTLIYDKSTAIYGYMQAKDAIRSADKVIVVEGNMDVLALHEAGIEYVVASSGTALTERQLKTLGYLTPNIYLCFDSDEAGVAATQRALETGAGLDVRLFVISLGKAKDPDDLLKKGTAAWQAAEKAARYAPDFVLEWTRQNYDVTTALGKRGASKQLIGMLGRLRDEIEVEHYIKKVSQLLDVGEAQVRKLIAQPTTSTAVEAESIEPEQPLTRLTRQEQLELSLFELCLVHAAVRDVVYDLDLKLTTERFQPYFQLLRDNPKANLTRLTKLLPDKANSVKIAALRGEQEYSELSEHDARLEAYTQLHRIEHYHIQLNKRQLTRAISAAEATGDKSAAKKLLAQYQEELNKEK